MKVTLWGTRGSLASPGPDTARYGGNTSCVEVLGDDGTVLILDAGTGLRGLGLSLPRSLRRVLKGILSAAMQKNNIMRYVEVRPLPLYAKLASGETVHFRQ